jgi:ApaG protein
MQRLVAYSFYRSLFREARRTQKNGLALFSPLSSEEIVRKFGQGAFVNRSSDASSTALSAAASVFQPGALSSAFILQLLSELSLLQKEVLSSKDILAAVRLGFSKEKKDAAMAAGGLDAALTALQALTRLRSLSDTYTSTVTSYQNILVKISVTTSPVPGLPVSIQTAASHFPFAYRVKIENIGKKKFQIVARHWKFVDKSGKTIEVPKGSPRIVGHAPVLEPGQIFEYVSGVELRAPKGSMKGSLRVQIIDAEEGANDVNNQFDALVAETLLSQT